VSDQFLRVVGTVVRAEIEQSDFPERIDHVWITLDVGRGGEQWRLSINTLSLKSKQAGLDPRIRVALICSTWNNLPTPGVFETPGFSYSSVKIPEGVRFEERSKEEMEALLLTLANDALLVEAWGVPYDHRGKGLHQIHSRAASSTVSKHLHDRDGALRFYFANQCATWVLLKFHGQE